MWNRGLDPSDGRKKRRRMEGKDHQTIWSEPVLDATRGGGGGFDLRPSRNNKFPVKNPWAEEGKRNQLASSLVRQVFPWSVFKELLNESVFDLVDLKFWTIKQELPSTWDVNWCYFCVWSRHDVFVFREKRKKDANNAPKMYGVVNNKKILRDGKILATK